uniref:E2 ubiquitin-conjugating enzyme n=1 Tax=Dunaliella tertiolecta TaxID=3047 RepID=A0A7S3VLF3_DUNTE|mmetsp:Transcript_1857/g.4236  ORF Transcript_1857/g.4236 Transcript_1857/m.4236 type:complete len:231 (-) Transcript_1857:697-1389(-)
MLSANTQKTLMRELKALQDQPPEGIRVVFNEHNLADVQAELDGPQGTPYENGLFRIRLSVGADYPTSPPKGFFATKIFHPNVSPSGEICVNVLKKDWTPETGLKHVLVVVRCLLIEPNPDSALNEEAGRLLQEDYEEFAGHARLMTSIHAQARRPGPLTTSGGNTSANNIAAGSRGSGGVGESGKQNVVGADGIGSPALKKAKSEAGSVQGGGVKAAPAASKVKKSLKRL